MTKRQLIRALILTIALVLLVFYVQPTVLALVVWLVLLAVLGLWGV